VEDLWDTFRVPVDDPDFIGGLPHLSGGSVAVVSGWIVHGEALRRQGRVPSPVALEGAGKWEIVKSRLPRNIERARQMVHELEGGTR
jgi:hypothetical protein